MFIEPRTLTFPFGVGAYRLLDSISEVLGNPPHMANQVLIRAQCVLLIYGNIFSPGRTSTYLLLVNMLVGVRRWGRTRNSWVSSQVFLPLSKTPSQYIVKIIRVLISPQDVKIITHA